MTFTSETLPADHKAAIRQLKRELRAQIGDVQAVFNKLSDKIATRVAEINALKNKGESVWPVIPFADVKNGTITDAQREVVKRRGCAVIKGHFPREQALAWDRSMLDYLDLNKFDEVYKGPGDNFFGTLTASRPEIYPIYWSQAQMQARQSEEMAQVQSFLNRLWTFESNGKQWFNPDVSVIYPDRIRRRPPGTTSKGLGAHTDSGALERWLLPAYQQVFARVFDGNVDKYDPWNAAHRTEVEEYTVDNTTKCSVFRTFQGWTALSDMIPGQGLLHVGAHPGSDGLYTAAAAAGRRAGRRAVRRVAGARAAGFREVAPAADRGADQHSGTRGRRFRVVALRCDPLRRAGGKSAGLGQRDVHPCRADVREKPRLREEGQGSAGNRRVAGRLPARGL
ncbi:protein YbiU [Enterobacter asburiae]|uniref:Protein YbiU n=1 Tax=Enterobacter asburiae TaxID=61645 RepID=A0A376F5G6_ENTAS|nr:protein YbiU [Enterobacter asburiae]